MHSFEHLFQNRMLNKIETEFFLKAKGVRSLGMSVEEIDFELKKCAKKNEFAFFGGELNNGGIPIPLVDDRKIKKIIQSYSAEYSALFKRLELLNIFKRTSRPRLLEIGFISGGYSLFGFEALDFEVYGVDNGYGGIESENNLPKYLKTKVGSNVGFEFGDITKRTPFPDGTFDVIYSASVLEHIKDTSLALSEMWRLLKPNGIIVHNYHPYFCHNGGHALGIGDSPWAHALCNESDYLNYIKKFRKFEAEQAEIWFGQALNPSLTLERMKRSVILTGFELLLWQQKSSEEQWLENLSPRIIERCLVVHPHISLDDLLTNSVSFVALKR